MAVAGQAARKRVRPFEAAWLALHWRGVGRWRWPNCCGAPARVLAGQPEDCGHPVGDAVSRWRRFMRAAGLWASFWIVDDPATIPWVGIVGIVFDIVAMPVVFFVAGFLAPASLQGRAAGDFVGRQGQAPDAALGGERAHADTALQGHLFVLSRIAAGAMVHLLSRPRIRTARTGSGSYPCCSCSTCCIC